MLRRLAVVACTLVLAVGLCVSPASASTAWQSAGYFNSSLTCTGSGESGLARGDWIDYACVPTRGGLWLLLVNVP